ncbi:MAG: glycosyltransferase family 4 protein, partial [Phycisphaerae bacterium]
TVTGSFRWHFPAHDAEKQSRRIQESFLPPRQYLLAERFCLLRSSGIVAVSDLVKKQMLRVHGGCAGRIRTIHNGHEPSRNGRGLHPYQSRNIQAGPKRFTAICVARLHRIKNIDHLIKAWAMVRYPAKRLLLVGSGEEMPALERLVTKLHLNDTVVFLGERLDVPYHLSHADVFILPSLYEACGSAAIEAMGAGLPCITLKNVDGITEVATSGEINIDGVTGFCVDPKDPRDMAGRIDFLADHPDIRDRMGRQSYERARTHFMWEHAAQAYVTFARDIVGRSRRYRRDVSH